MRSNESQRETRKKDKMERELKQAKVDLETRSTEMKTMQGQIDRYKADVTKLEQQLKEQRIMNERAIKDSDILNARFQKLQQDFESQLIATDQMHQENQARVTELKVGTIGKFIVFPPFQ